MLWEGQRGNYVFKPRKHWTTRSRKGRYQCSFRDLNSCPLHSKMSCHEHDSSPNVFSRHDSPRNFQEKESDCFLLARRWAFLTQRSIQIQFAVIREEASMLQIDFRGLWEGERGWHAPQEVCGPCAWKCLVHHEHLMSLSFRHCWQSTLKFSASICLSIPFFKPLKCRSSPFWMKKKSFIHSSKKTRHT